MLQTQAYVRVKQYTKPCLWKQREVYPTAGGTSTVGPGVVGVSEGSLQVSAARALTPTRGVAPPTTGVVQPGPKTVL